MSQTGLLEIAHENLYWPSPNQIWKPSGAGAKFYAELASKKIGQNLRRTCSDADGVKVGILAANPDGTDTETPIAIVCEFSRLVSPETIRETYRLAWSFSRARSLITLEPNLLRVWSCCVDPKDPRSDEPITVATSASLSEQATDALQWVELVSGQFFQDNIDRFKKSGSADQMLLSNLKEVRRQLYEAGLHDYATIHDLLARIIFIQFLFQKRDSEGNPALNDRILQNLYTDRTLSKVYRELPELLENFEDTYQLFRWLNVKFNGDLFPGKGEREEDREAEWQAEINKVRTEDNRYLNILAQFIQGDLEMQSGQLSLWKFYSFDVIPLDFISSIYEEFVKKDPKGSQNKVNKKQKKNKKESFENTVHYTPEYVVDFILDGVLPWDGEGWNLKILDPCCGSGIFLVKAFQRLIYRWEKAHSQKINPETLRNLLEGNLFGIDIDQEAVRVASFSLYLTMIDSIDPLEYWENSRFPILRNRRLICADFFKEDEVGFRTQLDIETYDLVIGNAPWGEATITQSAKIWADNNNWTIADNNIAPLFSTKAAILTKRSGLVSLIQPASALLFNQLKPAKDFRKKFFAEIRIREIINLSALRFKLFPNATSPPCIITFSTTTSDGQPFLYICPKLTQTLGDDYRITIEPQDISEIYLDEAINNPIIWATLMWGGRRDVVLMSKLSRASSIEKLQKQNIAKSLQGVIRGSRKEKLDFILNKRILDERSSQLVSQSFLFLKAEDLPINQDDEAHRNIQDSSAFESPQMIIKMSWQSTSKRFSAFIVESDKNGNGIICSGSYVSVHLPQNYFSVLQAACLSYNSKLAVYYLLLSSHRFAGYRPEVKPSDLLRVPIPELDSNTLKTLQNPDNIDEAICHSFSLKESEWTLIEDLFNYTLLDFKGNSNSPGRKTVSENQLSEYCKYFIKVIKAGFGQRKKVSATIFQQVNESKIPIILIAIHLNYFADEEIRTEQINSRLLLERLNKLNELFITHENSNKSGIFYQRVARIYDSVLIDGIQIPTVYLVKPDRVRYWTRSMALRDADEVVADIVASSRVHNQDA
ncbi:N-6 DNA methylase [Leptolyngbya sp. PL-A3]|uniref:HsdM family class I SAM-dependent methyltransferase n=1 Tax=Leptolyngbya sp. PL-A3 TaxID=2933911 RepID=UPI003297C16D